MPKATSSIKDTIINVLMLALLAGVLAWRYDDCKKKEAATQKAAENARIAETKAQESRTNACLNSVAETDRTECIRCTCKECIEEFEICAADKECSAMSVATLLAGGGPPPESLARRRFEQRAVCMFNQCGSVCTTKP